MKSLIKLITDLQSSSEFEIVLKRIAKSEKPKFLKEIKFKVIQESLKEQNNINLMYKLYKNCTNDCAALKIILCIHKLMRSTLNFQHTIHFEQLFQFYRKKNKQQQSALKEVSQHLIYYYYHYIYNLIERGDCYQQLQINEQITNIDINSQIASQIIIVGLTKKIKPMIPYFEYILQRKQNELIATLISEILIDAKLYYEYLLVFVSSNEYYILQNSKNNNQNLLIYQLYVDLIQITIWIQKLFQLNCYLQNKIQCPNYFIVNKQQNKEYELFIQSLDKKYIVLQNQNDSSPMFQRDYEGEEEKRFNFDIKPQQEINTNVGQSERPLDYNPLQEQNVDQ